MCLQFTYTKQTKNITFANFGNGISNFCQRLPELCDIVEILKSGSFFHKFFCQKSFLNWNNENDRIFSGPFILKQTCVKPEFSTAWCLSRILHTLIKTNF